MKRTLFILQFVLCSVAFAVPAFALKTVTNVVITERGSVIAAGDSLTLHTTCTYSDLTTDACVSGNAGSPTVTSYATCLTNSGLVITWSSSSGCDPNNTNFPSGAWTAQYYGKVCYQGICDTFGGESQHVGDTFTPYITPDWTSYNMGDGFAQTPYPVSLVVGAIGQLGLGYAFNNAGPFITAEPAQYTCNWSSADPTKATVDRYGAVTAVGAGTVVISCNPVNSTNVDILNSTQTGWTFSEGGNGITITVTSPTATLRDWYQRSDGGNRFDATFATSGLCDGLSNLPAAGATSHHCALKNLRDFYWINASGTNNAPSFNAWIIGPGDTVHLDANGTIGATNLMGSDATNVAQCFGVNYYCYGPPVPSGTAAHHTKIIGFNAGSCTSDSSKSLLLGTGGQRYPLNLQDSQFVDVSCVEITQTSQCGGIFTNACANTDYGQAQTGIITGAMDYGINLTDVYIYGMTSTGIFGASGYNGITYTRLHIQGLPAFGINMDDAPWTSSNISVAGGLTMNDSIIEWVGCVAEHPVVHAYPYIECRDQTTSGGAYSPDAIGEGNTSGKWVFDNVIVRYNWQDGFDMLHAGMQYISITNSQAYGNIGASYKIGPSDYVELINNQSVQNCQRLSVPVGDEPPTAIVPGATYCRGNDWVGMSFAAGIYKVQFDSFSGYEDTPFDYGCGFGYTRTCADATTLFENNTILGFGISSFNSGQLPGLFNYPGGGPGTQGWGVQDYNNYFNTRQCPTTLGAHETCSSANPVFTSQPTLTVGSNQTIWDNFNFLPTPSSPLVGAGVFGTGVTTDILGATRPNPPSIGSLEQTGTSTVATPTFSPVAGTYGSSQSITITTVTGGASIIYTNDGSTPTVSGTTCTITHGTLYTGVVTVGSSQTLKAIGCLSGDNASSVATAAYIISQPTIINSIQMNGVIVQ